MTTEAIGTTNMKMRIQYQASADSPIVDLGEQELTMNIITSPEE